jgi:hypothetical protein
VVSGQGPVFARQISGKDLAEEVSVHRCRPLWALAHRLWPVPTLAARRHLATDHRPAGLGRRAPADHLAGQRRLHGERSHQYAAGGRNGEPATRRTGRGRQRAPRSCPWALPGRLSCKLHLAVEQGQRHLSIMVTAGHRGDSPQTTCARCGPGSKLQSSTMHRCGVEAQRRRPSLPSPGGGI